MATQINLDNASRVDVTCRKGDSFELKFHFYRCCWCCHRYKWICLENGCKGN